MEGRGREQHHIKGVFGRTRGHVKRIEYSLAANTRYTLHSAKRKRDEQRSTLKYTWGQADRWAGHVIQIDRRTGTHSTTALP